MSGYESISLCELLTKGIPVRQKVGSTKYHPICRENFYGTTYFCPGTRNYLCSWILSLIGCFADPLASHILITNNIKFLRFGKLKITANISHRATRHGISGISFRAQFQSKFPFYVLEWGLSALALVQTWTWRRLSKEMYLVDWCQLVDQRRWNLLPIRCNWPFNNVVDV